MFVFWLLVIMFLFSFLIWLVSREERGVVSSGRLVQPRRCADEPAPETTKENGLGCCVFVEQDGKYFPAQKLRTNQKALVLGPRGPQHMRVYTEGNFECRLENENYKAVVKWTENYFSESIAKKQGTSRGVWVLKHFVCKNEKSLPYTNDSRNENKKFIEHEVHWGELDWMLVYYLLFTENGFQDSYENYLNYEQNGENWVIEEQHSENKPEVSENNDFSDLQTSELEPSAELESTTEFHASSEPEVYSPAPDPEPYTPPEPERYASPDPEPYTPPESNSMWDSGSSDSGWDSGSSDSGGSDW